MKNKFIVPNMIQEARKTKGHNFFVEVLIFAVVFIAAAGVQSVIVLAPTLYYMFNSSVVQNMLQTGSVDISAVMALAYNLPDWLMIITLFACAANIILAIVYCTKIEKRTVKSMGATKKNIVPEYLLGLAVGFVLFSAAVGIAAATGALSVNGLSPQIPVVTLILLFLGYIVQGAGEEFLCRGYLMVSVSRKYCTAVGVAVSSVAFGLLHMANNGVTILAFLNLVLFGVFAGVYVLYRGSIWGVCAVHTIWNFAQGNIYGISVSGMNTASSVFNSTPQNGKELFNGGTFGLEGSVCVSGVLVVGIAVVIFLFYLKSKKCSKKSELLNDSINAC